MNSLLTTLTQPDVRGRKRGIYSVCSAHPWVIEAAMAQAEADDSALLIEATCNQVNQMGGYTGMQPADFVQFVRGIAEKVGFEVDRLVFGGDHLGPNPWRHLPAHEAMRHAVDLLQAYAQAGFQKLHLDASMRCADDAAALSDESIAQRAARLCQAAEAVAPGAAVYVIGTEVPVPGGAIEDLTQLQVTAVAAVEHTLAAHQAAFEVLGLHDAWARVIALVVQPGVEFDHTHVIDYRPEQAEALARFQQNQSKLVFEAHSTDYQGAVALARLVDDGVAILKVGPGLTFALREALYALELVERELLEPSECSRLRATVEAAMCSAPSHWQGYYHGTAAHQAQLRVFSYSDRVRYYWGLPAIAQATERLITNLEAVKLSENLISQYLPQQYAAYRQGRIGLRVKDLLLDKVRDALRPYAQACRMGE